MTESKFSDQKVALIALEQLRSCENIDEFKETFMIFLPFQDEKSIKLFLWLNNLSFENKTLKSCIANKDFNGIKEILQYQYNNISEDRNLLLKTLKLILLDNSQIEDIIQNVNDTVY